MNFNILVTQQVNPLRNLPVWDMRALLLEYYHEKGDNSNYDKWKERFKNEWNFSLEPERGLAWVIVPPYITHTPGYLWKQTHIFDELMGL